MQHLKWILGILLVALSGVALILHKVLGVDKLGQVAVDAIEAAHRPHIDLLNQKLDALSKDQQTNQVAIDRAQRAVDARKEDLSMVYRNTGMSDDQVVDRLAKMKV